MPAFLALIPVKDWVYGGIIVALLVAFGAYTVHERHEGAAKIEAADAKVVAAQVKHNAEVDDVVKSKVAAAIADYDALQPIPVPAAVPVLVCKSSGSGAVLQSSGTSGGSNVGGTGVSVGAKQTDEGFDPAPAVSADGTAADAEIEHLQKKITLLQALVHAYQDGGLVAK